MFTLFMSGEMDMERNLMAMAEEGLGGGSDVPSTAALLAAVTSSADTSSPQILAENTQVIKSNLGQFVVLQQNQVRIVEYPT